MDDAFLAKLNRFAERAREREEAELRELEERRRAALPQSAYSVRLPQHRLEQLRRLASMRATTPSALIREIVAAYLDGQPDPAAESSELAERVRRLEELVTDLPAAGPPEPG